MTGRSWLIGIGLGSLASAGLVYLALGRIVRNGSGATPCPDPPNVQRRVGGSVPDGGVSQLALGGDRSCAITREQRIRCWGAADATDSPTRLRALLRPDGALMQVGTDSEPLGQKRVGQAPAPAPGVADILQLAQHRFAYCTLSRPGVLGCLSIAAGKAGIEYRSTVTMDQVQYVEVGNEHACALKGDGGLWCWGRNDVGQVGLPKSLASVREPTLVRERVANVTLGLAHTCALLGQPRRLECWGDNSAGQLSNSVEPTPSATDIVDLAASASRTCAWMRDGSVQCWGRYSITYPVSQGGVEPAQAAVQVLDATANVVQLAAGGDAFCARTSHGKLICWGYLGVAHGFRYPDPSAVPTPSPPHLVDTPRTVVDVGMGDHHVCALLDDGNVVCMGSGEQRQLGAVLPTQEVSAGPCGKLQFEAMSSSSFLPVAW